MIDAHSINGGEIHKISGSFAPTSFEQTRRWARARMENINGINCYHVQALNAQNFGRLYTVQKKGKNKAVATYSVDTGSCTGSYWKSVKHCYHVQALNAQNFGRLYTVQKKGKNKAVATYSVDTGSCTGSYWKSVKLAKANVDAKFASLR